MVGQLCRAPKSRSPANLNRLPSLELECSGHDQESTNDNRQHFIRYERQKASLVRPEIFPLRLADTATVLNLPVYGRKRIKAISNWRKCCVYVEHEASQREFYRIP